MLLHEKLCPLCRSPAHVSSGACKTTPTKTCEHVEGPASQEVSSQYRLEDQRWRQQSCRRHDHVQSLVFVELASSLIASRSLRCTAASPSLVQAVPCHRPRSSVAEACVSAAFVARLERMFSACVCLFLAFVGGFHGSHAGSSFTVISLTFLNAIGMPRHSARSQC